MENALPSRAVAVPMSTTSATIRVLDVKNSLLADSDVAIFRDALWPAPPPPRVPADTREPRLMPVVALSTTWTGTTTCLRLPWPRPRWPSDGRCGS